jgi:hypothetical protein
MERGADEAPLFVSAEFRALKPAKLGSDEERKETLSV